MEHFTPSEYSEPLVEENKEGEVKEESPTDEQLRKAIEILRKKFEGQSPWQQWLNTVERVLGRTTEGGELARESLLYLMDHLKRVAPNRKVRLPLEDIPQDESKRMFLKTLLLGAAAFAAISLEGCFKRKEMFVPSEMQEGIGVEREKISGDVLEKKTRQMIDAQTFGSMRHSEALPGARRINGKELQAMFSASATKHDVPKDLLKAIAWIESFGRANAKSPKGPKGIMQFSVAAAKEEGLYSTEIRRVPVRRVRTKRGKRVPRYVNKRIIIDERNDPKKSIDAAAQRLKKFINHFGREDLAVFAYHCGKRGVDDVVKAAKDEGLQEITMPSVFFRNHPGYNQKLYSEIEKRMKQDFSPTYWFRVARARELLALYDKDKQKFEKLWSEYSLPKPKDKFPSTPTRYHIWLADAKNYKSSDDLQDAYKKGELVTAHDEPTFLGFKLREEKEGQIGEKDKARQKLYLGARKEAIGALTYIAFETRLLFKKAYPSEEYQPLDVTSLVRTLAYQAALEKTNVNAITAVPSHCTGFAFDISYLHLSSKQLACLELVLRDLEIAGLLSVTKESKRSKTFHIVPSPDSFSFFKKVYKEAADEM